MATDQALATDDQPDSLALPIADVFTKHAHVCRRFALRIVHDPHLADDVVQEVFEATVRHPERYDEGRGTQLAWLLALTHHKAVDVVRWHHRHTRLDTSGDAMIDLVDRVPTPDDVAWLAVERERIIAGLAQLRPGDREVLVLAYFGGYSQTEIARRTGLPLGTVKGRTRNGIKLMRGLLADVDPRALTANA